MVKHEQQTAGNQGYGAAYNAVNNDGSISSLQETIAGMNIKHAESLQAFSKLSQSNCKTQSCNMQLENEIQSLQSQLQHLQQHTANAAMQPQPLMTLRTFYQQQPPPQYQPLPPTVYNPSMQQLMQQMPQQQYQGQQQYGGRYKNNYGDNRGRRD